MDTRQDSQYQIPYYVVAYCKGRSTEVIEYLTDTQYARLIRNPDVKVRVLDSNKESEYLRCLITRYVLPLTVMKNPMLLRAAELEFKTYSGDFPMSLQEAKWALIDEWPETNCIAQPYSCHKLIREKRGQFRLCLSDTIRIAKERRDKVCTV